MTAPPTIPIPRDAVAAVRKVNSQRCRQKEMSPKCPNRPKEPEMEVIEASVEMEPGEIVVPEVRLPVPVPCERLIPFCRIVGSLMEWSGGLITDRELCQALRKAAVEVERGGF
jgi:hypothetical protein